MVQVRDKEKARWLIAVHHESAEMEPNQRLHKMVRGRGSVTLLHANWTMLAPRNAKIRVRRDFTRHSQSPIPCGGGKTDQSHPKRETHTPTCNDSQESVSFHGLLTPHCPKATIKLQSALDRCFAVLTWMRNNLMEDDKIAGCFRLDID